MVTTELDTLASAEADLSAAMATRGAGADVPKDFEANYLQVFDSYLELAAEPNCSLEALKRATFLAWYQVSEPVWLTGLGGLPADASLRVLDLIEIHLSQLDAEFRWMLEYYFMWEYAFPELDSHPNVAALRRGLHVDDLLSQVEPALMVNRGMMGSYFSTVHDSFNRQRS